MGIGAFKWKRLLKKGARILKLWAEAFSWKEKVISDLTIKAIRDQLLITLKGMGARRLIDPPLPMLEVLRNEFDAYKKSQLQEYLHQTLLREWQAVAAVVKAASPHNPFCTSAQGPTLNLKEFESKLSCLVEEVKKKCEKDGLFDLRWYRLMPTNVISETSNADLICVSTAPTQCETVISPIQQKASIVRIGWNILKTISFYCQICSSCILRNKEPEEVINEYCKRVLFSNLVVVRLLRLHDRTRPAFPAHFQSHQPILLLCFPQPASIPSVFLHSRYDHAVEEEGVCEDQGEFDGGVCEVVEQAEEEQRGEFGLCGAV